MTHIIRLDELPEHPAASESPGGPLRLTGLVGQPREFRLADLAKMPQSTVTQDFECEEGWLVPHQVWQGVLVGQLLEAVGVQDKASSVEFGSGDFRFSLPIAEARSALVALRPNDAALTHSHGGPCRLYVPGEACYTSVKWLDHIEVRKTAGSNHAAEIARRRTAPIGT